MVPPNIGPTGTPSMVSVPSRVTSRRCLRRSRNSAPPVGVGIGAEVTDHFVFPLSCSITPSTMSADSSIRPLNRLASVGVK